MVKLLRGEPPVGPIRFHEVFGPTRATEAGAGPRSGGSGLHDR